MTDATARSQGEDQSSGVVIDIVGGRGTRRRAVCSVLVGLAGCAPHLTVEPQILAGSYRGVAEDGEAIVIRFTEEEAAFRGEGSIGGAPAVVAGAVGWSGAGSLVTAEGGAEPVELRLSADGERVVLERPGRPAVTLLRADGAVPSGTGGPFAGSYRAARGRAPLARVTLVQSGELLAGFGIVTGDPVGVTGRVTGPATAAGLVTFRDGSQVDFRAELAPDGSALTVRGFGEPIALERRGPS